MKKILFILFVFQVSLISCADTKNNANDTTTLEPNQIMEIEKANDKILNLETDIQNDIDALDTLLNELDNF